VTTELRHRHLVQSVSSSVARGNAGARRRHWQELLSTRYRTATTYNETDSTYNFLQQKNILPLTHICLHSRICARECRACFRQLRVVAY
jgi:hypothetical protein